MQTLLSVGLLTMLWIINLINGTGLNEVYHITTIAQIVVMILSACMILIKVEKKRKLLVRTSDFYIFGGMTFLFLFSSYVNGNGFQAINYLWMYLLVFLIAQMSINEKVFMWTSLIYGVLGLAILVIYDYGTVLQGWNENSIAMIGMHSFLMLIVPFYNRVNSLRNKCILIIVAIMFAFLLLPTNSRSGILFLMIGTAFALNFISRKIIIGNHRRVVTALLVPLFIAVCIAVISGSGMADSLNTWSYETFQKPIFNGRDELWIQGFEVLSQHPLIGTGNLAYANWHNSAVACLVAYGAIGYILWVKSFYQIFKHIKMWLKDYLVMGCLISFVVLYIQQSVELGFIGVNSTLLPYIMLGMMLGRVKYLKKMKRKRV